MTLFSSDDLNQVFPEATQDALQDPNEVIYTGYAEAYVEAQESAGRVALTGGKEDAIGELLDNNVLNNEINNSNDFTSPEFKEKIQKSYEETMALFASLDDDEFNADCKNMYDEAFPEINWKALETVYDYYKELGYEPKIITYLEGVSLDFWEELYGSVEIKELNTNITNARVANNRLELKVDSNVVKNWSQIVNTSHERWAVCVLPTEATLFSDITHDVYNWAGITPYLLDDILKTLAANDIEFEKNKDLHPSIEGYLTAQLLLAIKGKTLMDFNTLSWLEGSFEVGPGIDYPRTVVGVTGDVSLDPLRVEINQRPLSYHGDYQIMRPTVRSNKLHIIEEAK